MPINCPHCKARILPNTMIRTGIAGQRKPRRPFVTPAQQPVAVQRIWRSMQIERVFTVDSVVATAEAKPSNVRRLIYALMKVGYVRLQQQTNYRSGCRNQYRLVKDTGPFPPRLRNNGEVYDLNLQKVVGKVNA